MLTVVNFFRGYLEVEITGPYPERFLNICSQNGITFWQLNRLDIDKLTARVRVLEFDRLKELSKRALCEVRVLSKKGAPFFVWRFRKRYLFIAGFLIFAAILYFSSLRIWEIVITGNETVSEEKIEIALKELGVGIGTLSSEIDPETVENGVLLRIPELRWLTVNVSGSKANVDVRERKMPPDLIDEKIPCNIVARKAGIIARMNVLEGTAQAAVGDTVKEGQLLAGGVVDTSTGLRLVHAMAKVEAKTWYTLTAKMPMHIEIKEYTGEKKRKMALIVAGSRINLYFSSRIPYERCDNMLMKGQWTLPGGFILPCTWISEEYREYKVTPGEMDTETAAVILRRSLYERLEELADGGEIVRTDYVIGTAGDVYTMTLTAECIEDIAKTTELPVKMNTGG
jgi:similar to stage IV sporulation protein